MGNTFKKIQTVTVGSGGASTIEFTNIPQTYTDLKIVSSLRVTYDGGNSWIDGIVTFNGSTSGYSERFLYGDGSTVGSANQASTGLKWAAFAVDSGATASVFSNNELYIPNYTSSNNKSVSSDSVTENNGTVAQQSLHAGLWSNSAAITSVTLTPGFGSFVQYSSATLYGVYNEVKATGGTITADANYFYHTFTSDGTFTPLQSLNVDYLVVAGGGGGGSAREATLTRAGGGGGAGGLRCTVGATGGGGSLESLLAVTAQAYSITVGAGGASRVAGNDSVFASITSTAGGCGITPGGGQPTGTSSGGSGGGGNHTGGGGNGTTNQGYAGGSGNQANPNFVGGGGGGAGAVGGTGSLNSTNGAGGAGVTTSISGTSTTYAGGGGGAGFSGSATAASGGAGGGGAGATSGNGTAGTANTGGGGGCGASATTLSQGGQGGSGIVIVRYAR